MAEFVLYMTLFLCIIAMIGENSNPRGMNIFWYKVRVKIKRVLESFERVRFWELV